MRDKLEELHKRWSSQLYQMGQDMDRLCAEKRYAEAEKIATSQTTLTECVSDLKLVLNYL